MRKQDVFIRDAEKTPKVISIKKAYLILFAKHFNQSAYLEQYFTVRSEMVDDYINFTSKSTKYLEAALRKLDGSTKKQFTKEFKKTLHENYQRQKYDSINELNALIIQKIKAVKKTFKINSVENAHVEYLPLKKLINKNVDENNNKDIPAFTDSDLRMIEQKINRVAKNNAKVEAFNHVITHINLTTSYKFRKLAQNVDEVFRLMEIDKNNKGQDLKDLVNSAREEYEIIDNIDFIINKTLYYQSLYSTFKKKFENK